jgi:protein-tyrosine phosphatase
MVPLFDSNLVLIDLSEQTAAAAQVGAFVNLSPVTLDVTDRPSHRVADARRFSSEPRLEGFGEAALFVDTHIDQGVAVHCNAGFQRSIPFLAFYLLSRHNVPVADTVAECLGRKCDEYVSRVESVLHALRHAQTCCV